VKQWLAITRDGSSIFTPTSASWLNAVVGFFSIITRRQIRRGVFKSVADLEDAIRRYIQEHNRSSKTFRLDQNSRDHLRQNSAACLYF